MKQITQMFFFMKFDYPEDYGPKVWQPDLWHCKMDENVNRVFISEMSVEVEIPDDFDPVPRQVVALEKEREEATAAYMKTLTDINERLSKLQAIGLDPGPRMDETEIPF